MKRQKIVYCIEIKHPNFEHTQEGLSDTQLRRLLKLSKLYQEKRNHKKPKNEPEKMRSLIKKM